MPKLINVRPFIVETPPPHKGGRFWHFVKLETDTGLEGWGETAMALRAHTWKSSRMFLIPISRERMPWIGNTFSASCIPV